MIRDTLEGRIHDRRNGGQIIGCRRTQLLHDALPCLRDPIGAGLLLAGIVSRIDVVDLARTNELHLDDRSFGGPATA